MKTIAPSVPLRCRLTGISITSEMKRYNRFELGRVSMKYALIFLVTMLPLAGCRSQPQPNNTIVYDQWWSSDFAANAAGANCTPGAPKLCESEARQQEAGFLQNFSAAFQSDPQCSGLKLFVFTGSKQTPPEKVKKYAEILKGPHWQLMVDFASNQPTQSWSMLIDSPRTGPKNLTSGEGSAKSIADTVCSIAQRSGGSIDD